MGIALIATMVGMQPAFLVIFSYFINYGFQETLIWKHRNKKKGRQKVGQYDEDRRNNHADM